MDDGKPKKKTGKPVKRRSALKTAGLATLGVMGLSVAGIAGRAVQTGAHKSFTDGTGFEPQRLWRLQVSDDTAEKPYTNKADGLIAAGLLAASSRNAQPWRFVVSGKTIDVLADGRRSLGSIDPNNRQMTIGVGCCIENMVLGASGVGITPLLNIFPEGPAGKTIARFTIFEGVGPVSKEAKALAQRHTNRGPYQRDRVIDTKILDALAALNTSSMTKLFWLTADSEAGKRFAAGTLKATSDFVADKNLVVDSYNWFRFTAGDHRDGLTLPSSGLPPINARVAMMLPQSLREDPHTAWVEMTKTVHLGTASQFGLIAIPALDDRAALIEAGRLWQRLHVQATVMGLAMQPLCQMIEMADRDRVFQRQSEAERTLTGLSTLSGHVFVFGFRLGYSRYITTPSPRRSIDDTTQQV
jgi:nitroreductase